jgi:acyl-CoA thioester hydrolase
MISGKTKIRVIYADTDQMGVVYYSRYFEFFERGRTELWRGLGVPYAQMEKDGTILPVIEAHCEYRKGPRYDGIIIIHSMIPAVPRATVRIDYELFDEAETIVYATGYTVHCFVNPQGRPMKAPKSFIELIQKHL